MEEPGIVDQFKGFLSTPDIFEQQEDPGFPVFEFPKIELSDELINELQSLDHPRISVLGKRMESFFKLAIQYSKRYELIASNIQVIHEKRTIGELDFLVYDKEHSKPLHIELVYKLYVYDKNFQEEIERYIGPNRRDSLPEKINKLKNRQFPLLFDEACRTYLSAHDLKPKDIEQQLCFKAQLFYPEDSEPESGLLNPACKCGKWISWNNFLKWNVRENLFHTPKKIFWSSHPSANSNWMSYQEFKEQVEILFSKKKSPLVWMKTKTSYIRFFIVWW
ncbi:DUF1853 family protein [Gramella sp. BOM4]|nr:DUF1853 family protein [Christiangramia bathymodioli]